VQSVLITVVSSKSIHGEVNLIQHYVIKFVSDFSPGTPVSTNNKTDLHDITEIFSINQAS
jgi:hypothetical protein